MPAAKRFISITRPVGRLDSIPLRKARGQSGGMNMPKCYVFLGATPSPVVVASWAQPLNKARVIDPSGGFPRQAFEKKPYNNERCILRKY